MVADANLNTIGGSTKSTITQLDQVFLGWSGVGPPLNTPIETKWWPPHPSPRRAKKSDPYTLDEFVLDQINENAACGRVCEVNAIGSVNVEQDRDEIDAILDLFANEGPAGEHSEEHLLWQRTRAWLSILFLGAGFPELAAPACGEYRLPFS